jgi:hypothetical protein
MIEDKTLEAISRFNLNRLESIYKHKFQNNEDIQFYEGITEASCCLIPHKNIFESYHIFKGIIEGSDGFDFLGSSPSDRVLMLISMMKVFQKKYQINNVVVFNFIQKAEDFHGQFGINLTLKTLYVSKNDQQLRIRKELLMKAKKKCKDEIIKTPSIHYFSELE